MNSFPFNAADAWLKVRPAVATKILAELTPRSSD